MGLSFDLSKIKDKDTVCWIDNRLDTYTGKVGRGMNPVTESIIFGTMASDMGQITERNYKQFYKRLHKWELLAGLFLAEPITLEQVQQHIGLSTNVFSCKNERTFNDKLLRAALENAERRIDAQVRQRQQLAEKRTKRAEWRNKTKNKAAVAK
jgi:hypothetical protein